MISKFLSYLVKTILIIVVPFILLIRGAVYLHNSYNYLPWVCILGGAILAVSLVFVYLSFGHQLFVTGGNMLAMKTRLLIAVLVVLIYVVNGIFYVSGSNLKYSKLSSEIRQVHPVLRLAVSTLIIIDKELLITDADRAPEDYKKFGLKTVKQSLHYEQSTGYSHALDMRTKDRPVWKNFLVQNYFRLMGFRTLRHIGTADHLHISLMSHDYPNAK